MPIEQARWKEYQGRPQELLPEPIPRVSRGKNIRKKIVNNNPLGRLTAIGKVECSNTNEIKIQCEIQIQIQIPDQDWQGGMCTQDRVFPGPSISHPPAGEPFRCRLSLSSFLCICVFIDEPAGQRVCSEVEENEAATRALRLFSRRQRRRCR